MRISQVLRLALRAILDSLIYTKIDNDLSLSLSNHTLLLAPKSGKDGPELLYGIPVSNGLFIGADLFARHTYIKPALARSTACRVLCCLPDMDDVCRYLILVSRYSSCRPHCGLPPCPHMALPLGCSFQSLILCPGNRQRG